MLQWHDIVLIITVCIGLFFCVKQWYWWMDMNRIKSGYVKLWHTSKYKQGNRAGMNKVPLYLTFICTCIANTLAEYNQQDPTFHNLFISVRRFAYFRLLFRPTSGAQNCTHSVRYFSEQYCYVLLAVRLWWKNRLKYAERVTEVNKLWNVASCWLYCANVLAMHVHMNVKYVVLYPLRTRWGTYLRCCSQGGRSS